VDRSSWGTPSVRGGSGIGELTQSCKNSFVVSAHGGEMMASLQSRFVVRIARMAAGLAAVGVSALMLAAAPVHGQPAGSAPASVPASGPAATLASRLPADAAIYVEIRGLSHILGNRAGAGVASTIISVVQSAATTSPADSAQAVAKSPAAAATEGGMRHLFATAVGLEPASAALGMLFSGPVAFSADGWSGLSDAVLLAWPANPAALEAALAAQRIAETASAPVRRYRLGNGHELACDGKTAVIGRMKKTSIYARTLDVLTRGGETLADTPEFRDRTASVAAGAQLIAYVGKARAGGVEGYNPLTAWWPDDWPQIKTIAVGLAWGTEQAHLKLSARLDPEGRQLTRGEPPIQILRRLPLSVVAAWTHAVDYLGDYRRLRGRLAMEPEGFSFDSLEVGLEPGTIEKRILGHLVGDTVLLVDQVTIQTAEAKDSREKIILPVGAILVETDDPDAVAAALPQVAGNLVRLFNSQAGPEQAIAIRQEALGPGGPVIYSLPIGVRQTGKTRCDLLAALELSWTVADRWLIVATHSQTVRRLVEARRGNHALLPITGLDQVVEHVVLRGGQPRRVLFAQPQAGATMIATWIEHISAHHPELLQAQWWERLLQRQRATGKQIGILARASGGTVEVVDTLPEGPARGRLLPGDRVLAVDGVKIDSARPLQSLRDAVAERGQPDKVTFLVRRGDQQHEIELPMPRAGGDGALRSPVELLSRFAAACRLFDAISYVLWQPRPDVVDVRVDLRYAAALRPAPIASQPAASQPATNRPAATQPKVPPTQPAATQAVPATAPVPAPAAPPATSPAVTQPAATSPAAGTASAPQ